MSPELSKIALGEANRPAIEIEPAAYVDSIRAVLHEGNITAYGQVIAGDIALIDSEAVTSRTYVATEQAALAGRTYEPEEIAWLGDGFSSLMARLVKISERAARAGCEIVPFSEINPTNQDFIRCYVLEEYIKLCETLANADKPTKNHYQSAPFLYHSAENVSRLIEDNEDLDKSMVVYLIQHYPSTSESAITEVRDNIAKATQQFPSIPPGQIRKEVCRRKDGYEAALRQYARNNGLRIDEHEKAEPNVDDLLRTIRQLARERKYDLSHRSASPGLVQKAQSIGKEALEFIDEVSGIDSTEDMDQEYSIMRVGFKNKVERLILAANKAWRKGDLPISPEQTSPEFHRALFIQALGDFLIIQAELGGHTSSSSMNDNPMLYYNRNEIRQIVADNPGLTPTYIRRFILRNPGNPQQALNEFTGRVEEIMQANPRLLEIQARRMAAHGKSPSPNPENKQDEISPHELFRVIRAYMSDNPPSNVAHATKHEISRYRSEIAEYYESMEWNFAGIELTEAARNALLKKAEELITASERAYRAELAPDKLSNLGTQDRFDMYKLLAEDFAQIGKIIETRLPNDWLRIPVLYVTPDEIAELRSKHDWLDNGDFRRTVFMHISNIEEGLERTARLAANLQQWYPGITEAWARKVAMRHPNTYSKQIMSWLRKVSASNSRRMDSISEAPDLKRPESIYKHLRTQFKNDLVPPPQIFTMAVEKKIAELRERAAHWADKQPGLTDVDEANRRKFLDQVELYVRGSEALGSNDSYPRILDLPDSMQNRLIALAYANQRRLNRLISGDRADGQPKFRVYEFGFFHSAKYLESLWRQYDAYFPQNVISYVALTSPRKPIDKLNDLVEYRARLVQNYPDLSPDEINQALIAKARAK